MTERSDAVSPAGGPAGVDAPTAAWVWPAVAATGLGPMPGSEIAEAARIVAGELPELPFLPELPDRGVGADRAGRTIALLVDIWADVVPSGWRISRRPSHSVFAG